MQNLSTGFSKAASLRQPLIWGLLIPVVAFLFMGCGKPPDPGSQDHVNDPNLTIHLSTNQILKDPEHSGRAFVYGFEFPEVTYDYNFAGTGAELDSDSPFRTGPENPYVSFDPFDGEFQGDTLVKVTFKLYLRTNQPSPDGDIYYHYIASTTTTFHIIVGSVDQINNPPQSDVPTNGYANIGDFGGGPGPGKADAGNSVGIEAPLSLIEGSDGYLYGVTGDPFGVTNAIVKFSKQGTNAQVLAQFDGSTYDTFGNTLAPMLARVVVNDNGTNRTVLIAAARNGNGPNVAGNILRMNEDGSDLKVIWQFPALGPSSPLGYTPISLATDQYGFIYGMTHQDPAGSGVYAVMFRLWSDGSGYEVLRKFHGSLGVDGLNFVMNHRLLIASNEKVYGVAQDIQSLGVEDFHPGKIFRTDPDGGFLEDHFHAFDFPPRDSNNSFHSAAPLGGLTEASDGFLYGTYGAIVSIYGLTPTNLSYYYRIAKDGSGFTKLAEIPPTQTAAPEPLVEGSDGRLYGFWVSGTNYLVAINPTNGEVEIITELGPAANNATITTSRNTGGLVSASDGAIYGTVLRGGANDKGYLFRYMPSNSVAAAGGPNNLKEDAAAQSQKPDEGAAHPGKNSLPPLVLNNATTLTVSTNSSGANAGRALALSGDTLVVGVPFGFGTNFPGEVNVFRQTETNWNLEATLSPPNGDPVALYGFAAALEGTNLVVTAPGDFNTNLFAGVAYVYVRSNSAWQLVATLHGTNTLGDEFGDKVALSGNRIIVGAPGEAQFGPHSGAAYVFINNGNGNWSKDARLTSPSATSNDYFGAAVAISGINAVVGSPRGREFDVPFKRGAAYAYKRFSSSWGLLTTLETDRSYAADYFGASVAISSNLLVVGMPGALPFDATDEKATRRAAIVYKPDLSFQWNESAQLLPDQVHPMEMFSASVALDENRVVIGAPHDPEFGAGAPGSAYVYDTQGTNWYQRARLQGDTIQTNDAFGFAVALSGDLAGVSALSHQNTNAISGAAYLFNLAVSPRLDVSRGTNGLLLEWDSAGIGFTLESSPILTNGGSWSAVTPSPSNLMYFIQPTGQARYFRLSKP